MTDPTRKLLKRDDQCKYAVTDIIHITQLPASFCLVKSKIEMALVGTSGQTRTYSYYSTKVGVVSSQCPSRVHNIEPYMQITSES